MANTNTILLWQSSALATQQLVELTHSKITIQPVNDHDLLAHAETGTLWHATDSTAALWHTLSTQLAENPEAVLHLIYEHPAMALAAQIDQQQNIKQAQTLWLQQTKQLIQFFKQHRKQCRLINASVIYTQPQAFFDYLTEHSINLEGAEQLCSVSDVAENHAARISYLIATQLLSQNTLNIKTIQELEACSHLHAQAEQHLTALQKLFSQVTNLFAQQKTDAQTIQKTQQQVKDLSDEKQSLENKLTSSEQENELIIEQLHLVQEALEQKLAENQTLDAENNLNKDKLVHQETRISWLIRQANKNAQGQYKASWNHRRKLNKLAQQINATELFDQAWYLAEYQDVAQLKLDPALHYLMFGANDGRNPSSKFNTLDYLYEYTDVALDGANPLVHFIKFGQYEGRKPDPMQKRLPSPNK